MIPRRKLRASDTNQLAIDWTSPAPESEPSAPAVVSIAEAVVAESPQDAKPTSSPLQATAGGKTPSSFASKVRRSSKGVVARLPVPKPLAAAVAKGRFGQDEEGRPIRPAADEVRAITENQADKLVAILDAVMAAPATPSEREAALGVFQSIIAAYSGDFGDHAARQLEAYVRRLASIDESQRTDQGWHR